MLTLRLLRAEDEEAVRAANETLAAEGFTFLLDRDRTASFEDYLDLLVQQHEGRDPHPGRVRATFLVAEVHGEIVGRVSIRHELNEQLRREGGHVGYGVLPAHRRQGYATEMLRQALAILAAEGTSHALVTCDDDNVGSAVTIERCGGELVDRVVVDNVLVRHYVVPTSS